MDKITQQENIKQNFYISRYEQTGEQLFVCLNSTNNPVYLEHFLNEDEKQDIEGTIEGLVAQLQILDDNYVAPVPTVSLLDQVKDFKIDTANIASKKSALMAERQTELETQKTQAKPLQDITTP